MQELLQPSLVVHTWSSATRRWNWKLCRRIHNKIKEALCNCASITEKLKCLKFVTYLSRPLLSPVPLCRLEHTTPFFDGNNAGCSKNKIIDPLPRKIQCTKARTEWILHFSHFGPCQGVNYVCVFKTLRKSTFALYIKIFVPRLYFLCLPLVVGPYCSRDHLWHKLFYWGRVNA